MGGARYCIMRSSTRTGIGYCRLSREDRGTSVGLEVQMDSLRNWMERDDVTALRTGCNTDFTERDDGFFLEDASGRTVSKRPIFSKLLETLGSKQIEVDVFYCYTTDRLSRNMNDQTKLYKFFVDHGIELKITNMPNLQKQATGGGFTASSLIQNTAQGMVDTFYPAFVSDKVRESFVEKAEKEGRWWGRLPPGFDLNQFGKLVPNCQAVIDIIKYLRMGYNPHEIANLNIVDKRTEKRLICQKCQTEHSYRAKRCKYCKTSHWDEVEKEVITKYYTSKVYRLEKTLKNYASRMQLPDEIYEAKPRKNRTRKTKKFQIRNVHQASSASSSSQESQPRAVELEVEDSNLPERPQEQYQYEHQEQTSSGDESQSPQFGEY